MRLDDGVVGVEFLWNGDYTVTYYIRAIRFATR
jgi:hypothetical protein